MTNPSSRLTLEQAVDWCIAHGAIVTFRKASEPGDDEPHAAYVRVEVEDDTPEGSYLIVSQPTFQRAVARAILATQALHEGTTE